MKKTHFATHSTQPNLTIIGFTLIASSLFGLPATAQILHGLPAEQTQSQPQNDLARGTSMESAQHMLGAPEKKHAAIGNPPITRWDYTRYSLYFEHNRLLHVVNRSNDSP